MSPLSNPHQQLAPQAQVHPHGTPQGMPPATHGGPHGTQPGYGQAARAAAPAPAPAHGAPFATRPQAGAAFVTGAYQSSGDPGIDRMIRLEAACKRFGSPI